MVTGRCLLCFTGCDSSKSGVFGRDLSCDWLGDLKPGGQGADLLGTPGDTLFRGIGLGAAMNEASMTSHDAPVHEHKAW